MTWAGVLAGNVISLRIRAADCATWPHTAARTGTRRSEVFFTCLGVNHHFGL